MGQQIKNELQIKLAEQGLAGESTAQVIAKRMQTATGEMPTGDKLRTLISIRNPELGAKTLPTGEIPQNVDAFDYIVGKVAAVNADETTPDYPEGIYVIKDRVIQVIDGNVRNIPLNELKQEGKWLLILIIYLP